MAVETLAQPYAWDAGSYKRGTGTNKGSWVYDSATWKQIKELYVWDSGSWKLNLPISVVDCTIAVASNGTCGAVNASYIIRSNWLGPIPQGTAGDHYHVEHWDRFSTTAFGIFGATWGLQGSFNLTTNFINPIPIFQIFVRGGSENRRWHQAQARLTHTVHGAVPEASGGIATSTVENYFIDSCGEE